MHALRHGGFGEFLRLHFFFDLQGQHFFNGASGGGFKDAFFFQEVIEFASNGYDDGLSLKINPRSASSMSCTGVAGVFLVKTRCSAISFSCTHIDD